VIFNASIQNAVRRSPVGLRKLRRGLRAFSLIEIMIVMGLLSVIVLGLMAMFNQTQRAFRLGMTQTDVLEAGRMATDLLVREVEQVTPCYVSVNAPVFGSPVFYSTIPSLANVSVQTLLGGTVPRTNVLQDLFFLTRQNQTWTGVGYFVRTNITFPPGQGFGPVGTLYRYQTNHTLGQFQLAPGALANGFLIAMNGTDTIPVSRIVDGVVHFRVRAFDRFGNWIRFSNTNFPTIGAASSLLLPEEPIYGFSSNAAPAYVEVELGILEPGTLERYRSFPVFSSQTNFLASQSSHVHLFRQRIAVRTVDPAAYPPN
jgi:type II secretory pathway pseudopilin PulG